MRLGRFSLGAGDRFARQACAQLRAFVMAAERGLDLVPVWNKSNREHGIVGSEPGSVRAAAELAVRRLNWTGPYHVDADHIDLDTVDRFIESSDFFTIDVARFLGQPPSAADIDGFLARHPELTRRIRIEGIEEPYEATRASAARDAGVYLTAVRMAGRIYRHIASSKGAGNCITEVSMDETDSPQTPSQLLLILAAVADEGIPIQTIAPKFTGRFNKGVDYEGDVARFEAEFAADLAVIAHAVREYGLPGNLKLSVHSGSDKFSIYPSIRRALRKTGAGVHIKTAGTTWLAELDGLAGSWPEGLELAKDIYAAAYEHREELCAPYAAVIDIDVSRLPPPATVRGWAADDYVAALHHDPACPRFDANLRQLLHVGYKIAAGMGDRYLGMLERYEAPVARQVTQNLFEAHIQPLFLAAD